MFTVFHQGCVSKEDRVTYFETREQAEKFTRRHRLNHMDTIIAVVEGEYSSLDQLPRAIVSAPTGATNYLRAIACKPLYAVNKAEDVICPAPQGIAIGEVCAYWVGSAFAAGSSPSYVRFFQKLPPNLEVYAIAALGCIAETWRDCQDRPYTPTLLEEAIAAVKAADAAWDAAKADVSELRTELANLRTQLDKLKKKPIPKGGQLERKKERIALTAKCESLDLAITGMELQASKDAKAQVLAEVLKVQVPTA